MTVKEVLCISGFQNAIKFNGQKQVNLFLDIPEMSFPFLNSSFLFHTRKISLLICRIVITMDVGVGVGV